MKWSNFNLQIWDHSHLISSQMIRCRIQTLVVKKIENSLGVLLERTVLLVSEEFIPIENPFQYRLKVQDDWFDLIVRNDFSFGVNPHYQYEGSILETPPVAPILKSPLKSPNSPMAQNKELSYAS